MTRHDIRLTESAGPLAPRWPMRIDVAAAARLHIGFLDLNFTLGRRFGSLGISIDAPVTRLSLQAASQTIVSGPESDRAARYLQRLSHHLGISRHTHLVIDQALPPHSGLGSGTQLALAVGSALARFEGRDVSNREIARLLGRGSRSGVGIAAFETGGVILDGGRGVGTAPAPVLARHDFPEAWRFVLVFDHGETGVHGTEETNAFDEIRPMAPEISGEICRLTLMQALPSLIEHDIRGFGNAITGIQNRIGDYFAPYQGGRRFASPRVSRALEWLSANGAAGVGQTSWGPTGYGLAASQDEAHRLRDGLARVLARETTLEFRVCRGNNAGARIVSTPILSAARG